MSSDRRRRGARLIGPAVVALVRELARRAGEETLELRLSAAAADAIARAHAREHGSLSDHAAHPARAAVDAPVLVDRRTALTWHAAAWSAARAGTIPVADARRIGEQLHRRGPAA
jgi:hypothetical protein